MDKNNLLWRYLLAALLLSNALALYWTYSATAGPSMQEEPTPAGSDNFVVIPAEGQVEQEQQPTPSPEEGFPAPVEQSSPSAG
ncbi:MAG: hypothetical protein GWP61_26270, partial [Chloroflexi bacterium]|nr:hypothetical protein [Chloroflexota bacterium]